MWGTVLATICAAPKLSKSLCEQQHAMHTTMKAKAIAEVLLPIRNCKDWEGPLQNCRLHSCPEIILQINQKRFLFLSSTKQLLQKGGLHHIPSCFNNLVCVKLLSTPAFPASPILTSCSYPSLSKRLGMCMLMHTMSFNPSFTLLPHTSGEGKLYNLLICGVDIRKKFSLIFCSKQTYLLFTKPPAS